MSIKQAFWGGVSRRHGRGRPHRGHRPLEFSISVGPPGVLLVAALLLGGCGGKTKEHERSSEPSAPAIRVKVSSIVMRAVGHTEEVVGTVRARERATLEAKVAGQIAEMPVRLGDKVKAGALLARLDAPEINARLKSAAAGLELAGREWKRVSTLFEQQAATRADYESAESRLHIAKAAQAEAQAMLGYVKITAPFAGRVARKYAERGDLAVPGKPLLELEDPSELELEAFVPDSLAGSLRQGASVQIRSESGANTITGTVTEIAPASDPTSRTLLVKLALPAADNLQPGRFARLLVPVGERESLLVPAAAVVRRGQLEMVFVVAGGKARMCLVRVGRGSGEAVEIRSGLPVTGDVVVQGAAQLVDGQPVIVE